LVAGTAALVACNKGPEVDVKNASVGEVIEKVRESGAAGTTISPGRWESKVTILDIQMPPGIPPQYAAQLKQRMAKAGGTVTTTCISEADLKKPTPEFLAANTKNCRFDHYTMSGGKIDAKMTCTAPQGGSMTMTTTGTYSADAYETTGTMTMSAGGMGEQTTKMHTESHRVGECTGNEINSKKQEIGQ
jgi:hypothetical protein